MDDCEKIAFGPLNLKPREFYALTPALFFKLHKGYKARQKDEMQKIILLANNKFYKDPLKEKDFIEPDESETQKTETDRKAEFEKLKTEF